MMAYGLKAIAKELGCSQNTIGRMMKKHADFPVKKLPDINTYAFDVGKCKKWWSENRSEKSSNQAPDNAMQMSQFARVLEVSSRMVLVWRQKGLEAEKLIDGTVWIDLEKARKWFRKQNDERTKAYAYKF
ncbi:hypothetical protein ACDZ28_09080 [Paenibacillus sp. RS8]|uniref:DNA-binding protein n=1 Tax=Paenibacillus odorifer TaxID=189426 RepID=A0A1R0Y9N3_9BACL|nr:hypothetical protein [Paenibacillus odorifer]OMD44021.1 hypothetical protein BSK52_00270 [Paenibacillus odorifer]